MVFGASGVQAGGVVKFLLQHPEVSKQYEIRGITRNIESAKQNCIFPADQVTWTQADLSKLESVVEAVKGADVVFGLTNFWEHCDYELDIAQGKNIVDACIVSQVDWLIWSSQYPSVQTTEGVLPWVPAVDGKANVGKYLEEVKSKGGKNGKGLVSTQYIPTFYMQNLSKFLVWPNEQGDLAWRMPWSPNAVVPIVDSEIDCGAYVAGILLSPPESMNGRFFHVGSEWTTPSDMVRQFEEVTGKKMIFSEVSVPEFAELLPPSEGMRTWLPPLFKIVGVYSEWGLGSREKQPEHDKVLENVDKNYRKSTWADYVRRGAFMHEYTNRMDAFSRMWTAKGNA